MGWQTIQAPDPFPFRGKLIRPPAAHRTSILSLYSRLHALGILHDDPDPRNWVVDQAGQVRLIDFGFASCIDWDGSRDAALGVGLGRFERKFGSEVDEVESGKKRERELMRSRMRHEMEFVRAFLDGS